MALTREITARFHSANNHVFEEVISIDGTEIPAVLERVTPHIVNLVWTFELAPGQDPDGEVFDYVLPRA